MYQHQQQFQLAVEAALEGATIITENKRSSRQLMAACERQLRAQKTVWETPDILPFEAWLRRTWQECVLRGTATSVLLNGVQQQALWDEIIAGSQVGFANRAGTVAAVGEAWRLLHEYGIALNPGAFQARVETKYFYDWAQQYRGECARNHWIDSPTLPDEIGANAAMVAQTLRRRIVLFGFDKLTPQQMRLMNAVSEQGIEVLELLPDNSASGRSSQLWGADGIDQTVSAQGVISACCVGMPDPTAELYAAARWARAKLEQNPEARIGVVAARLNELRADAEFIFTEVLHPEAMLIANVEQRRAFDISLGPTLASYPIVQAALLTLRVALDWVSLHEAGILIRSPYLADAENEAGQRARFDSFLCRYSTSEVTARKICDAFASEKNNTRCPQMKKGFVTLAKIAGSVPSLLRCSDFAGLTEKLLDAVGWPGDRGGRPLNSTDYQATEAWADAISQFATLDAVLPPMSPSDDLARIVRIVNDRIFKPENAGAPVQVMGMLEATGSTFDHLWVSGVSDDVWPPKGTATPFLPRSLQQAAGVPHSSPAQDLEFAEKVRERLANSAGEVIFSWPKHEEDRLLRRSPLLAPMREITESGVMGSAASGWADLQRGTAPELFQDDVAPAMETRPKHDGGTRLFELQSNCPFLAFAEMRLGCLRPEEPVDGIRPTERGQLVERALELVWSRLRDHFTLVNGSRDDLDKIIGQSVDEAMKLLPVATEAWEIRYRKLERERLARLLNEWLDLERQREPFEVVGHQLKVVVSAGPITVNGRIDRLDRTMDGGLVVIDYKSGNGIYGAGQWRGPRPEKPQLPLYVTSQTTPVSAVAFGALRTGDCALKGYGTRKEILAHRTDRTKRYFEDGDTFEDHIEKWKTVLKQIAEDYMAGNAKVDPQPERVCEHCHLRALCRRSELLRRNHADEIDGGGDDE